MIGRVSFNPTMIRMCAWRNLRWKIVSERFSLYSDRCRQSEQAINWQNDLSTLVEYCRRSLSPL